MTERKPPGVSWGFWIEHLIESGQRDGAFDNLPGHGRPIGDLDRPHDEMWWVKQKLRAEGVNHLPATLSIRLERDDAIDRAMAASDEAEVRDILDEINARIRYVNSHASAGPPSTVVTIDADEIVDRWKTAAPSPETLGPVPPVEPDARPSRMQLLRKLLHRLRSKHPGNA